MACAVLASAAITATVVTRHAGAAEPDPRPKTEFEKDVERLDAEAAAKMARWAELAQPGPEHERLGALAGEWGVRTSYWTHPEADPLHADAVIRAEPIFGGRFLLEKHALDDADPSAFGGLTIRGYDNQARKHTLVWLDATGTHMIVAEGEADATGDIITYFATYTDPMDEKPKRIKIVHTRRAEDAYTVTLYEELARELWFKHIHSAATRR